MTKFKVYRIDGYGSVTVDIITAAGWLDLIQTDQFNGHAIFKIEAVGVADTIED